MICFSGDCDCDSGDNFQSLIFIKSYILNNEKKQPFFSSNVCHFFKKQLKFFLYKSFLKCKAISQYGDDFFKCLWPEKNACPIESKMCAYERTTRNSLDAFYKAYKSIFFRKKKIIIKYSCFIFE